MKRSRFLPFLLALGLAGAFPLRAEAPATPGIERYLPSLRAVKANNDAILKRQEILLKRIEEARKTAETIRILTKRG